MSALSIVTADGPFIDSGNTAWVLTAAALVLFMTPGLAFFYGGMVRTKSVLNMMMMSFITMGTVGTAWILWGYSETFGADAGMGLIGNPFDKFGLTGVFGEIYGFVPADAAAGTEAAGGIPGAAFVAFQVVFAIIAVALVSGAVADRVKFGAWTVFTLLWATLVYFPVAHWVFAFSGFAAETGGWIANKAEGLFLGGVGAYDFAGGTAIHINAGVAGLALALIIRNRVGWGKEPMRPHNLTLVMMGAGILWFGWFGFNAGSALSAGALASGVWVNTLGATCTAMLGWLIVEKLRDGHPTSLGAASGVVAGLVAITPACATVSAWGASSSASSPAPAVPSRSASSSSWASTTASTSSASTWSAVSSARCSSASSRTPRTAPPRRPVSPRTTACSSAAGSASSAPRRSARARC